MAPELDFKSKKHNYDATHVKVFVHGYLSATDIYNKAKLIKYIELGIVIKPIQGRVYNFHSNSDRVLKFKPSLEKCIGRHAIDTQKYPGKVYNAHIDIGHTDYWDNLRTVFNYVKNEGERYIAPADMLHKHLLTDLLLYQVVVFSDTEDLLALSRILSTKKSSNTHKECFDAQLIAHEIQLMGGHTIANKARGGKGVSYAEIVEDVASKLGLAKALGQQTTLEKEQAVYQEVLTALKSYAAVSDVNLANDEFFTQCFAEENYTNSIETLHKILNDIPIDPAGAAYSVTIPIVAVMHFLRKKLELD